MSTTHPTTRTAACGECWTYAEHLPSCSAAPEYGPGDPAPAVLHFDRDGRDRAEWEHADRQFDAGEFSASRQ